MTMIDKMTNRPKCADTQCESFNKEMCLCIREMDLVDANLHSDGMTIGGLVRKADFMCLTCGAVVDGIGKDEEIGLESEPDEPEET